MQNSDFQAELSGFIDFRNDDFEEILEDLELDQEHVEINKKPTHVLQTYEPVSSLKSEERKIIQSCTDPNLRNLLNLNRTKRMQLIQMYKHLKDLLAECQENIRSKEHYISQMKKTFSTNTFVNPWKLAAPYFKDKNVYPSPLNSDALTKKSMGELSIYDRGAPTKWTTFECEIIIKAVKLNYNMNKQKDKQKKIVKLKSNLRKAATLEEKNVLHAEIGKLNDELEHLKADTEGEVPEIHDSTFIDWYRIASFFLKGKHTAQECESFWNLYLHPSVNKSSWTEEENQKIIELGHKYEFQNWDKIAAELQTGRTGFLVCIHYSGILSTKYRSDKFSAEEDTYLLEVVAQYKVAGSIKWGLVAQHFSDRSKDQLFHRYTYYLQPLLEKGSIDRSKFTEAEDVLLLLLVEKYGKNFVKCAEHVPNRTYMQLKNRYNSNLETDIRKGTWSTDDDRNILKYVEEKGSKSWGGLAKTMKRSRGQLRQRYLFLVKYLTKYPGSDLSKVPKRKHRMFGNSHNHYNFLKFISEKFKTLEQIPTLDAIENCLQSEKIHGRGIKRGPGRPRKNPSGVSIKEQKRRDKSKLKTIDSLLVDFFSNSHEIEQVHDKRQMLSIDETVKDVKHTLNYLDVTLELPEVISKEELPLDETDLEILEQLRKWKPKKSFATPCFRIPTTINTLVGLRSVLIKYQSYKNPKIKGISGFLQAMQTCPLAWSASNLAADEDTKNRVQTEMDTFYKRFKSLFLWPSVFSLVAPPVVVQIEEPHAPEVSSESDESMEVDDDLLSS